MDPEMSHKNYNVCVTPAKYIFGGWTLRCHCHNLEIYICCIPKCDHSRCMLWWTPTLADCPIVSNCPFSITIRVLKPKLLQGYKELRDKYVGLIGKRSDRSALLGLLVMTMCQTLDKLQSIGHPWL